MGGERVIMHVDMDAFFAAIEQRDNPALAGRPVVVGADPKGGAGRGVVSTCSYEARRYGIHSAQPISQAYRLCPHAAFVPVDGARYRRESQRIRRIFEEFTPQVEPVSIDEAFLDVTGSLRLFGDKRRLARQLQGHIERETALTASLGVAANKLVAKIASDLEKPRGLVIVEPGQEVAFLAPLEVRRLPGVGPKMQAALSAMGVRTVGDLAALSREQLGQRFGEWGGDLFRKARGRDDSRVRREAAAKSIGHEHTFEEDTAERAALLRTLSELCERTAWRVRTAGKAGRVVTTKVRFDDFTTLTRRHTLPEPVADAARLYEAALKNLEAAEVEGRKVRLIGVQVSGFPDGQATQTQLFDGRQAPDDVRLRVARAEDAVKGKFGRDALRRGTSLERPAGDGSDGPE